MKKYLSYYKKNVYYLPCAIPEEIIWNENFVDTLLQSTNSDNESMKVLKDIPNAKKRIHKAAEYIYGDGSKIEELENILISVFTKNKNQLFNKITQMINDILQLVNN